MPGVNGFDLLPAGKERRTELPVFDDFSLWRRQYDRLVVMGRGAEAIPFHAVDFPKLKQGIMASMGDARGGNG